ncbi:MAG: hypothetical protein NTX49_02905 [Chlamydiae bacterium]|nr:hypothetical protein [Chlamydiota bacterium]
MASPVTTIQTSPVIQRGLADLSSTKLKKGEFSKAIAIISRLGEQFRSIGELSPISRGRVSFIGDFIINSLEENRDLSPEKKIKCIIIEAVNLKNALQLEALFFGMIYPRVLIHSRLTSSPLLRELRDALPEILHGITAEKKLPLCFIIDAAPVNRLFDRMMTSSISDDFSIFMLLFFSDFKVEGGKIQIPSELIPSKEQLEPFLESLNPDCKLIAQILYACALENDSIYSFHTSREEIDITLASLEVIQSPRPRMYQFHEYLAKKPLIPLFSSLLEERDHYLSTGIPCVRMLSSGELLSRLSALMGEDWLEESADTYELIRKIELSLRTLFRPGELSSLTEVSLEEGIDRRLYKCLETLKTTSASKVKFQRYPDPMTILQGSKEDFKSLAFYRFWEKEQQLTLEAQLRTKKSVKSPSGKKAGGKGKPSHKAGVAASGSSTSCKVPTILAEPEEEPEAYASAAAGSAPEKASRASTHVVQKASPFLRGISLAPRVAAWNESPEAGLDYYGYGSAAGHVLPRAEMILRHRFPQQMLSIIFTDHYSKHSILERTSGELCKQSESVLEIDGKKYMLEATVDSKGVLFHYYARPLTRFADYFHLTRESPSEFPALEEKEAAPTPLPELRTDGIEYDPQGNAHFDFDGHHYKMLLLKSSRR